MIWDGPLELNVVHALAVVDVDGLSSRGVYWTHTPPVRFGGRVETAAKSGGLSLIGQRQLLTTVYIDGFNLYHRALRGTPFKWLDLSKLASNLLPNDEISKVRFFTARINARPDDPSQPQRQQVYLRALESTPNVTIHLGIYRERVIRRPLAEPIRGLPRYVRVLNSEEKGTDVNLTTSLLVDGFQGNFQKAAVVTNDSDFVDPIKYVRDGLGLDITLINPATDKKSQLTRELKNAATEVMWLRRSHLRRSQLPLTLTDQHGVITKPKSW